MNMVKISNIKEFKNIIDSANRFLDDIRLVVDDTGMHFKGLTQGHTVFLWVDFDKEYFEELSMDSPYNIDISTTDLLKILKMGKQGDYLSLIPTTEKLRVIFDNDKKKTHKEFGIKLLDLGDNTLTPPNIELPVSIDMGYEIFNDLIKDANLVSDDAFTLTIDNTRLIIKAEGAFGDVEGEYIHGSDVKDSIEVSVATQYMINALSMCLNDNITINAGTQLPVIIGMNNDDDTAHAGFMIAPRIEVDD